MPLKRVRTNTSSADGSLSDSSRISPRPGAATQKARDRAIGYNFNTYRSMTAIRWRFPVGSLRGSAVMAKLVALAAVAVASTLLRAPLHLGALYPLKALILFSGMMALAIGFLDAHHPFARYGVANQITTVRAALVALMGSLIGEETTPIVGMGAAITGAVTILLDGVDGWVARRTEMQSRFGARYDMEIHPLLILVLAALAWKLEKAGAWVLLSG